MSFVMGNDPDDPIEAEVRRRLRERQLLQAEAALEEHQRERQKKNPPFVQFAKSKMPNVRQHLRKNPLAVELFLFLAEHMDTNNIVICSQQVLMEQLERGRTSVYNAIKYLEDEGLVCIVKFGTTNGYAVEGAYVWTTFNKPARYAVFENAKALASNNENAAVRKRLAHVFGRQKDLLDPETGKVKED